MSRAGLLVVIALVLAGCLPEEEESVGGDAGSGADGGGGGGQGLPVDCSIDENSETAACVRPSSYDGEPLGSGPRIKTLPGIGGGGYTTGFVDGNRLIIGVAWGSDSARQGFIAAVDLRTGDRTVVSGTANDPATGPETTGQGPAFGRPVDVERGSDGKYYVLNSPTSADEVQIVRVDPATGDRELVWDGETVGGACPGGRSADNLGGFAIGPDDKVYLGVANNPAGSGVGIVAIDANNGASSTCTIMSLVVDAGSPDNVGGGPELSTGYYIGLTFVDGAVWGLNGLEEVLVKIDAGSGMRTIVSGEAVGSGPEIGAAYLSRDAERSGFWTAGGFASSQRGGVILVDGTSGAREEFDYGDGPAFKGTNGVAYAIPDRDLLVMVADDYGIVLYDPATTNSNNLSL